MQDYVVNRPDEGAMNRILAAHAEDAAGAIQSRVSLYLEERRDN